MLQDTMLWTKCYGKNVTEKMLLGQNVTQQWTDSQPDNTMQQKHSC